mmetsp:Transcript_31641/g.58135  ORF Transcript_31641/g.58135 Transcript_31641/m.58135 type:complete len:432 (-) Transcript_31641:58-1353(-)
MQHSSTDAARSDRLTWWGFCWLWLGGNWAYQSILQAQAYYADQMPGLSYFLLLTFSWPLLGCHLLNILSGAAKAAGLSRRVYAAYILNALTGVAFIVQDLLSLSVGLRYSLIMCLGAVTAVSQVLLEPALFSLAALTQSSGAPTQAMMAGNAATGVIVWVVSVSLRLAAGGRQVSPVWLRAAAHVFFALLVIASAACAAVFMALTRHGLIKTCSEDSGSIGMAEEKSAGSHNAALLPAPASQTAEPVSNVRRLLQAAPYTWIPAMCQFLIFWCTLASWPSIPAAAPLHGPFALWGKEWWFLLVVGIYNFLDFVARLNLRQLQRFASVMGPRQTLAACCFRIFLVPAVYFCVRPCIIPGVVGNVVILLASAVLALSNGFLATAGMMQASTAPAPLTEDGINVASIGVYLGLATGSTTSLLVARFAMGLDVFK